MLMQLAEAVTPPRSQSLTVRRLDAGTVPAGCEGYNRPDVLVQSGVHGMQIALTANDVYWASGSQVFRTPKSGGTSQTIDGVTQGGRAPSIDSNRLYWGGESFTVYGMLLDTPLATPTLLASQIAGPDAWTVSGDALYFAAGDLGAPTKQLDDGVGDRRNRSSDAGWTEITQDSVMAADATGVYWYDDQRAALGTGLIRKYTLATGQVTKSRDGRSRSDLSVTGGGRVVWADAPSLDDRATIVGSNTPDGSQPVDLGSAACVYQLAIDGTSAYFAGGSCQGAPEGMSITEVPLAGGSARTVACVHDLYSLAVDTHDVFYSTWLADGSLNKVAKP